MDEKYIEMGEATQEAVTANGVAAITAKAMPSEDLAPHQYKRYDCEECEVDLPTFRMAKGFTLCTSCQKDKEKAEKRY